METRSQELKLIGVARCLGMRTNNCSREEQDELFPARKKVHILISYGERKSASKNPKVQGRYIFWGAAINAEV